MRLHRLVIRVWVLVAVVVSMGQAASAEEPAFRFAAIADTHIAHPLDMVRFRRFLYTLRKEKPDFLLILGDACGHAPEYLPQIKNVCDTSGLKVHVIPGNHDDNYARNPEWFTRGFGPTHYSFDHKGYHFVMNWSQSQPIEWLKKDLAAVKADTPIVFCQHYPPGDKDAEEAEPWTTLRKHPNAKLILAGHRHRHREGKLGSIRSLVLGNCYFSPAVRRGGTVYFFDAYPGGKVQIRRRPLSQMKLLDPPDKLPSAAISAPGSGDVLKGVVTLRGTASDDSAVRAVEYSVDFGPWRKARGTGSWRSSLNTASLDDGHHLIRVRSTDSAGQISLNMPSLLCFVANRPAKTEGVYRFQQGVDGYTGCSDLTVRRQQHSKSPRGSDGRHIDLENWVWGSGRTEYFEFYIRFDLSRSGIPADATIKRVTLTLFGSRMNGVKSAEDDRCRYAVAVLKDKWGPKMTFKTRPAYPGWTGGGEPHPKPDLVGRWPYLGGRQIVVPPRRIDVGLTDLKRHVARWIKDPSTNHGLVFAPYGPQYNFSAQSSRAAVATLRPRLAIEVERP